MYSINNLNLAMTPRPIKSNEIHTNLFIGAITVLLTVVGYFGVRTVNQGDRTEEMVRLLQNDVSKITIEVRDIKEDVTDIKNSPNNQTK